MPLELEGWLEVGSLSILESRGEVMNSEFDTPFWRVQVKFDTPFWLPRGFASLSSPAKSLPRGWSRVFCHCLRQPPLFSFSPSLSDHANFQMIIKRCLLFSYNDTQSSSWCKDSTHPSMSEPKIIQFIPVQYLSTIHVSRSNNIMQIFVPTAEGINQ
jgi:hypothetical protein